MEYFGWETTRLLDGFDTKSQKKLIHVPSVGLKPLDPMIGPYPSWVVYHLCCPLNVPCLSVQIPRICPNIYRIPKSINHHYPILWVCICDIYIYTYIYIYIHTYMTLQYITLHCITLHYITYITIQYNTIQYITVHYITLHTYIHTYIHIYTL